MATRNPDPRAMGGDAVWSEVLQGWAYPEDAKRAWRLSQAAEDMLAALEDAQFTLGAVQGFLRARAIFWGEDGIQAVYDKVTAAIAKAEGKSDGD